MKTCIINGKRYEVTRVMNMVVNYEFKDDSGAVHLVDAEDAQEWADEEGIEWKGVETAIAYAKHYAEETQSGIFWWKVK